MLHLARFYLAQGNIHAAEVRYRQALDVMREALEAVLEKFRPGYQADGSDIFLGTIARSMPNVVAAAITSCASTSGV